MKACEKQLRTLEKMKRFFDLIGSIFMSILFLMPLLLLFVLIKLTSKGPVLYWSTRVGKCNRLFKMPKLRTMKVGSPNLATHLLVDSSKYLTSIGPFLRKSSLDELPQLWCILKGDMSFIGPRPALFNQDDLIALRTENGLDQLTPGITGWAQVNGRDELSILDKVKYELEYFQNQSIWLDMRILGLTFLKVICRKNVSH
jgi:O-antigen biosynthesis protein WbqP